MVILRHIHLINYGAFLKIQIIEAFIKSEFISAKLL